MRRRITSLVLRVFAAVVAVLHVAILWHRIDDLSITEPLVIARWCVAAVAAAIGLFMLHRGVSWRVWLVFAMAILLLHVAAPVDNARIDMLAEAMFALAPALLILVALLHSAGDVIATLFETTSAATSAPALRACAADRAPPVY